MSNMPSSFGKKCCESSLPGAQSMSSFPGCIQRVKSAGFPPGRARAPRIHRSSRAGAGIIQAIGHRSRKPAASGWRRGCLTHRCHILQTGSRRFTARARRSTQKNERDKARPDPGITGKPPSKTAHFPMGNPGQVRAEINSQIRRSALIGAFDAVLAQKRGLGVGGLQQRLAVTLDQGRLTAGVGRGRECAQNGRDLFGGGTRR